MRQCAMSQNIFYMLSTKGYLNYTKSRLIFLHNELSCNDLRYKII